MNSDSWYFALAPELILLAGGCAALLLGLSRAKHAAWWTSAIAFLAVLIALVVALRMNNALPREAVPGLWLTSLTDYTRWVALGVGAVIVLVNWNQPVAEEHGEYVSLILFSFLGILLTASANDWVVFFFAIELVSVPTYVLVALSRTDARASEAAVKYFFLGALSAAILAYGIGFLYAASGTTAIYRPISAAAVECTLTQQAAADPKAIVALVLIVAGLSFKIAAVPFHGYVADVYEGAASPMAGLLGFVPKLAGFVALIRVLAAFDWAPPLSVQWALWAIAAATMTVGNVLGLIQRNVKRTLAYSSVAHTGYMLVALLAGPVSGQGPWRDGVAALLFYMAIYGLMNLGAFAVLAAHRIGDRDVETLDDIAGLARRAPVMGFAFAVCLFSLMGLPPTAGLLGKLYILGSAFSLRTSHPMHGALFALAIVMALNTAVGAAYYLRIIAAAYVGTPGERLTAAAGRPVRLGVALCTLPLLLLFPWPMKLLDRARTATDILHAVVHPPAPTRTTHGGTSQPLPRSDDTHSAAPGEGQGMTLTQGADSHGASSQP